MDQREELWSLYSVVCPHCKSVSQADENACPYCGADRHGAVLTRGHAALFEVDGAVKSASLHIANSALAGPSDKTPRAAERAAKLSPLPGHKRMIAILAAGICVVAGAMLWTRAARDNNVPEPKHEAVSSTGAVRPLVAPAAPVAPVAIPKKPEQNTSPAQQQFLAMTASASNRTALDARPFTHAPPCAVTTGAMLATDAPWCEPPAPARSTQIAEKTPPRKVSAERTKSAGRQTNARRQSTNAKPVRAQATTKSVRHSAASDKKSSRTRATAHQKKAR